MPRPPAPSQGTDHFDSATPIAQFAHYATFPRLPHPTNVKGAGGMNQVANQFSFSHGRPQVASVRSGYLSLTGATTLPVDRYRIVTGQGRGYAGAIALAASIGDAGRCFAVRVQLDFCERER